MRRIVKLGALATVLAAAGAASLHAWPIGRPVALETIAGDAARGAYLARMSGCIACHTDAEGGGAPLVGGVELPTDFGTFHSPNLTTDIETGIGGWSIREFSKAVRQGISPDGEPYYPAFPYPFYSRFSDQDIADLWAAFQTVPAVAEAAPEQELRFPFSFRPALKAWRAMFLDMGPLEPREDKSDAWNRGRYIVRGPAHCGACHTPRNMLGARQAELRLHGADGLPGGGESPPITKAALEKGGWTVASLSYALRSGITPDGDVFGGSMGEVVRDGTAFLSDDDLRAIAIYLLDKDESDEQ
ncbi:cytochrome c [Oricola sp.]|uniref:c-type cytochrome n=1 Tax=Oricola sp. TaxID=1979950 RepID=UPI003514E039